MYVSITAAIIQWAPLNSASKYADEFGPVKLGEHLTRAGRELRPGKSGPIKQYVQLSRAELSGTHCTLSSTQIHTFKWMFLSGVTVQVFSCIVTTVVTDFAVMWL